MRSVKGYANAMKVLQAVTGMSEEEIKVAHDSGTLTEGMDEQELIHNMLQMMKDKHLEIVKDTLPPETDASDEDIMRSVECGLIHVLITYFKALGYPDSTVVEVIWYAMRKLD